MAQPTTDAEARRSPFDESMHPHAPKGSSIGGQFVTTKGSGGSPKSSGSPKPASGTGSGSHGGRGPHVHIPKGSFGYDPASNHGTGYGHKNGDPHVHKLQQELNRLGFTDAHGKRLTDDGKLGPLTTSAIIKAKRALGIKPADGIVDPAFIAKLAALKTAPKTAHHTARSQVEESPMERIPPTYRRTFDLEGIEIVSRANGGDGRTVEAYAAVFNVPQEIHDQHGDYTEVISPKAFARAIDRGWVKDAMVLYNHGRSVVDGRPDSLAQVPLGSPLSIEADGRGLRTVTRYNKSQLADSVLEAIRNGDITAQSFRGPIYKSTPAGPVKRVREGQALPTVTRMELGLTDYGPTPSAYYRDAKILAVRARDIVSGIADLDEAERAELIRLLTSTRLGGDLGADDTATPIPGPGPEDLRVEAHSGRSKDLARQRQLAQWAELAEMEMAFRG